MGKRFLKFRFFDNDFADCARGAVEALANIIDFSSADHERLLVEFKFLIHYLANVRTADYKWRTEWEGKPVKREYFDKCVLEQLDHFPYEDENMETIIVDCQTLVIIIK